MKATASPMYDDTGRRLGTVLEWFDRTQEVATETEAAGVISAVTAGNLEQRIALEGKRVVLRSRCRSGINDLVDAIGRGGRTRCSDWSPPPTTVISPAASRPRARPACW